MANQVAEDMAGIAEALNAHLEAGGAVQVTTYLRSTLYRGQPFAGWFTVDQAGELYVKRGRTRDCLSCAGRLLVGIRTGHLA